LQWTGIPDLDWATFDLSQPEYGSNPSSFVRLAAKARYETTRTQLCDTLGLPEKAPERGKADIYLPAKHPGHSSFWKALRKRELEEVDGPMEWWWRLLILRYRGIARASRALIRETLGDELDHGIISFDNPSLESVGRTATELLVDGNYVQPKRVVVAFRIKRSAPHEGLAFSLEDASFKARFVSKLIGLAVART
jgi:hypothetical protein